MEATALKINIQPTKKSRIHEIEEGLKNFGRVFSDHMYVIDYLEGEWKDARIVPYGDLPMSPATSALHYGQAVFEGMKAYRNEADEILLFRATDNLKRLNKSAVKIGRAHV